MVLPGIQLRTKIMKILRKLLLFLLKDEVNPIFTFLRITEKTDREDDMEEVEVNLRFRELSRKKERVEKRI